MVASLSHFWFVNLAKNENVGDAKVIALEFII